MDLGSQIPSVIDEIKARYRIPKRMPAPQYIPEQNELRSVPRSQVIQEEPQSTIYSQRENVQPLFGVKSKRLHQKPEALLNLKTKPVEPPPDIKFTKVEVRPQSANKTNNYADTIFTSSQPVKKPQQKEIHARGSPGGSEVDIEEEEDDADMPTKENFKQQAPTRAERTTQSGFRTNANQQRETPQRSTQPQFKSQKVHFDEVDDERDPTRVLISSAKKEERRAPPEFHYQRAQETTQNQLYDDYIE